MKKRKSAIGMVLLVAIFMLGIGYAAISDIPLNITGSAESTPSDENFKVIFSEHEPTDNDKQLANSKAVVETGITNEHTASLRVSGLTTTNDTVTATYTIKNNSPELGAVVSTAAITNSNEEYFEVTSSVTSGSNTVAAGDTTTLVVTVKLKKTPTVNQTANLTIPFNATPAN